MQKTIYSKKYMALVEKIVRVRKELNLRQSDVARLIGKSQSYVSKMEAGQLRIDVIQLNELAQIYKKTIGFFVEEKK